jgi:hypothetical protein
VILGRPQPKVVTINIEGIVIMEFGLSLKRGVASSRAFADPLEKRAKPTKGLFSQIE